MATALELALGALSKNIDAASASRNIAEAQQDSRKYINAVIDTVKVVGAR